MRIEQVEIGSKQKYPPSVGGSHKHSAELQINVMKSTHLFVTATSLPYIRVTSPSRVGFLGRWKKHLSHVNQLRGPTRTGVYVEAHTEVDFSVFESGDSSFCHNLHGWGHAIQQLVRASIVSVQPQQFNHCYSSI